MGDLSPHDRERAHARSAGDPDARRPGGADAGDVKTAPETPSPPPTAVEAAWRRYLGATRRLEGRSYDDEEEAAWRRLAAALERAGAPLPRR
jgi:hypothetical protein